MKIFISSLIRGMEAEREAARAAVVTLGHEPMMAEDFCAQDASPQVACLQGVRQSDFVLLILGDRYGQAQRSGMAPTHEEFAEARNSKPMLVFRQHPRNPEDAQARFIEEVGGWSGRHWKEFSSPAQLGQQIVRGIHEWQLANASGPVDGGELDARSLRLLPETRQGINTGSAMLSLSVACGPNLALLRAGQIEDSLFGEEVLQLATFRDTAILALREGVEFGITDNDLVLRQNGRAEGWVHLAANGDLTIHVPLEKSAERGAFMVVLEEDVRERLTRALRFAGAVLARLDPTEKITHVALAARLSGTAWGWRTRAEQAASPTSGTMSVGFGEDRHEQPVQLTPAHMRRATLAREAAEIIEELVVLLRRRWKRS